MTQTEKEATFLEQLASGTPTPGGGSAAAYAGAMAAALVAMVARTTLGKKKYANLQHEMEVIAEQADQWRYQLIQAVELDANAFTNIIQARRLPVENEEGKTRRDQAIREALFHAAETPLQTARILLRVMEKALYLAENANLNAIADAAASAALCRAAIETSVNNSKINIQSLESDPQTRKLLAESQEIVVRTDELHLAVAEVMQKRGGIR